MKVKRLISFTPKILQRLKREAAKREISVSELMRNIVDAWFAKIDGSAR
jgi:hypothetical protein